MSHFAPSIFSINLPKLSLWSQRSARLGHLDLTTAARCLPFACPPPAKSGFARCIRQRLPCSLELCAKLSTGEAPFESISAWWEPFRSFYSIVVRDLTPLKYSRIRSSPRGFTPHKPSGAISALFIRYQNGEGEAPASCTLRYSKTGQRPLSTTQFRSLVPVVHD